MAYSSGESADGAAHEHGAGEEGAAAEGKIVQALETCEKLAVTIEARRV